MANSSINLTSLDFADYKNQLKTYLKSQPQFQDYNFDGSNLSVVLDILAYNTYMNAFYMNMIGSEMFLDTAVMRDSVVLKAKELNYVPRSFRSSTANVDLTVTVTDPNNVILTIPKGTSFSGKAGSNNYIFTTDENIVLSNGTLGAWTGRKFIANNIQIFEGTYVSDTFVVQPTASVDIQRFVLSNPTIDTNSLTVTVIENNGANVTPFKLSTSILDLRTDSSVYFLQGAENNTYEIVFGDNVVGRRPLDNSVVVAEYRVTNGQLPNGISTFKVNGTIGGSSNVQISTANASYSYGGDIGEDIESIRRNAPRFFATQERAVTTGDYETLMTTTYPEIQAISVYGGEEANPPQYGKVFLSMKIANFDVLPTSKKTEYTTFLKSRAPLTIDPIFVDPDYTYASVTSNVKYNINKTSLSPADIQTVVTGAIQQYNIENLNKFKGSLYYSRLVESIDVSHPSIVSNETDYVLMKKLVPDLTKVRNYTISFDTVVTDLLPPEPKTHIAKNLHAFRSSKFLYNGQLVNMEDDGEGNIRVTQEKNDGNHYTVLDNVGTINYTTGTITIKNFYTSEYIGDSIRLYVIPLNKDNSTAGNIIFEIPNDEINVTASIVRL